DQIGPLTRTVEDNARVLAAISGKDQRDTTTEDQSVPDFTKGIKKGVKDLRIGVPKEYFAKGIDEGVKDVVKKAIAKYESLGAKVDEVSLPHSKYGIAAYYILASSEASSNLERFDGIRYGFSARQDGQTLEDLYVRTRSEGFGDEVKRRIMLGTFALSAGFYDAYFKKAAQVRT
ncbi:amidase family protein, partial [Oenococcus oeni]